MTHLPSTRLIREKIEENKRKIEEAQAESVRIAEEKTRNAAPLITKDDLVGAIGKLTETNTKEIKDTIQGIKDFVTSLEGKIGTTSESFSQGLTELSSSLSLLDTKYNSLQNNFTLSNEERDKLAETFKVDLNTSLEEVKLLIPKEKELTVKDIKGLVELFNSVALPTSQPLTIDIFASGLLAKSGATKLNFTGATVTQSANITTITPGSSPTAWGSITGTLSAQTDLQNALNAKQDLLVSGTNIKTVNGVSILGSGDIPLPNGTSIVNVSTDSTITLSDGLTVYLVNATSGNINITLPTATSNTGQYDISKIDSSLNTVTLLGTVNSVVNPTLDFQDDSVTIISNGTSYRII